jgi:hypothetical protein
MFEEMIFISKRRFDVTLKSFEIKNHFHQSIWSLIDEF